MSESIILLSAACVAYMLLLIARELHTIGFVLWHMNMKSEHKDNFPNN